MGAEGPGVHGGGEAQNDGGKAFMRKSSAVLRQRDGEKQLWGKVRQYKIVYTILYCNVLC